jgi:hypothetical protein
MIHCIGDSHSAVFSGKEEMQPVWPERSDDKMDFFRSYRIGPATAFQLSNKVPIINQIVNTQVNKDEDHIMFCFGEVDIRAHLIKQTMLNNTTIEHEVSKCIENYSLTLLHYKNLGYKVIVWGPIASWHENKPYDGPSFGTNLERNIATKIFNKEIEKFCEKNNIIFLTIFHDMVNEELQTIELFLDDWSGSHIHLSQRSMSLIVDKFKEKNLI